MAYTTPNKKQATRARAASAASAASVSSGGSAKKATPKSTPKSTSKRKSPKSSTPKSVSSKKKQKQQHNAPVSSPSSLSSPLSSKPATVPLVTVPAVPPPKPQISVQVHRFRNANYIPRSILKLCATPPPSPPPSSPNKSTISSSSSSSIVPHLAISREGGSVELISIDEKWKCVAIVEGLKKRNVDAMAWLCPNIHHLSSSTALTNTTTSGTNSSGPTAIVAVDNDDPSLISDESESHSSTTSTTAEAATTATSSTQLQQNNYFSSNHQIIEEIQSKRRLFGASRDGTIFEIDFKTKTHQGVIGSGGGAVFCLESMLLMNSSNSHSHTNTYIGNDLLAAGCEDGSVRIFKSLDRQSMKMNASGNIPSLELISTLPSVGCAVTSIVWIPPPSSSGSSSSSLAGSVLYAGVADGTIRKFTLTSTMQDSRATGSVPHAMSTGMMLSNSSSGTSNTSLSTANATTTTTKTSPFAGLQWKANARLTVENQGKRISTKIWSLKALDHGNTIVSGDSMGNIQFWDGTSGTLLQSIAHNKNDADVLDLAVSLDQTKIMASGIDSRVVCLEYDAFSKTSKKWILSNQQRSHTHDVNSLAMVYMTDPTGSVVGSGSSFGSHHNHTSKHSAGYRELLCSGGVDTKVCSYLVSNMRKYRPKIVYKYPSNAPVVLSKEPRLMSIMRPDQIDIYQLRQKVADSEVAAGAIALDEEKAHLGSVRISSTHNLISFDVNNDGTLLAASHAAGIYLFSLEYFDRFEDGEEGEENISRKIVKPSRIDIPMALNSSCSSLRFSKKDPNLLVCAHCNGTINVLKVDQDSDDESSTVALEHSFKDEGSNKRSCSQRYPITHLDISQDGQWIATGRNSIGKGCLNVYSLSPTYRQWWTLPCTEAPFACMKWLGNDSVDPTLVISLNNGVFYLFDVKQRCLSDWSQNLGFPASPYLPKELSQCKDCPDRLAFNPFTPNKFLMVSS